MRARRVVAVTAALACVGHAGSGGADPLPAGDVAAASARPRGTDELPKATTPVPDPWVYVHLDSEPGFGLETYDSGRGTWLVMCQAPCDGWVPLGREFRVYGEGFRSSGTFQIDASPGQRVELAVVPGRTGVFVSGIAMIGVGGLSIVVGGLVLLLSAGLSHAGPTSTAVEYAAPFLGAGGGVAALGLLFAVTNGRSAVSQRRSTSVALRSSFSRARAPSTSSEAARLPEPIWRDVTGADAPWRFTVPIFAHSF